MNTENKITDEAVDSSIRGNEKYFQILYHKYADSLRFFAFKYLCDNEQINDVIQDAFIALYERIQDFNDENSIKSFLYRKIGNDCLNIIRHEKVKDRYSRLEHIEEETDYFLDDIIQSEVFYHITKVFKELSPACRQVYQLSLDGKSHDEIAAILNISINTVKKHKNNANHYMRKRLKDFLILLSLMHRDTNQSHWGYGTIHNFV